MSSTPTPTITALWREAGSRVAAAGLPLVLPNRTEMVIVAVDVGRLRRPELAVIA